MAYIARFTGNDMIGSLSRCYLAVVTTSTSPGYLSMVNRNSWDPYISAMTGSTIIAGCYVILPFTWGNDTVMTTDTRTTNLAMIHLTGGYPCRYAMTGSATI